MFTAPLSQIIQMGKTLLGKYLSPTFVRKLSRLKIQNILHHIYFKQLKRIRKSREEFVRRISMFSWCPSFCFAWGSVSEDFDSSASCIFMSLICTFRFGISKKEHRAFNNCRIPVFHMFIFSVASKFNKHSGTALSNMISVYSQRIQSKELC